MAIEVFYRPNPEITLKLEIRDPKGLFEELGPLQEIMDACKCGCCGGTNVRFLHRKVEKFDYYELQCLGSKDGRKCRAKLSLGQDQENKSLFPRRYAQDPTDPKKPLMKDGKKVFLPNNGWTVYNGKESD